MKFTDLKKYQGILDEMTDDDLRLAHFILSRELVKRQLTDLAFKKVMESNKE